MIPAFRIAIPALRIMIPAFRIAIPDLRIVIPTFRIAIPDLRIVIPVFRIAIPALSIAILKPKYDAPQVKFPDPEVVDRLTLHQSNIPQSPPAMSGSLFGVPVHQNERALHCLFD